jgi:PAS domain S-box-containing protein
MERDGTQVPIDHSGAPSKDAEGNVFGTVLIFRDVTEGRAADRAQALLASIVESSDDAIVSKSLNGIVRSWNTGAERLFGYQASEIIGQSIMTIVPPDRIAEEQLILERLRRGERLEHFETVRVTKGGRAIPISLTVSPIRNRNGEIIGASKIARDITYQKLSEEERERQLVLEQNLRNEAQAANRLKDEFLATISHELRTPLNAILGWTTMLRSGKLDPPSVTRAIEVIERNAKSQAQLIEDLLDVSRIVSGKVRLDMKPVAFTTVLKAAMESVQPAADAKGIHLQMIVNAADDRVKADATRLQQIIWNLLSNSIKFTPKGGKITVKLDRTDSIVQITVTDTGAGISPEFLPFVFDRFKQADGAITKQHGGLGLGLAISRHLVEMHGGTIEADSPGEALGATFTIRLPLAAVRATAVAAIPSARNPRLIEVAAVDGLDLNGVRILVVDDEPDAREMLRVVLEKFGADVTTASSATDALNVLPAWKPAVMVCDIGMPEEDGYALIKKVRALSSEEGGNTPAIALTGHVRVEERMRALAAGYEMFVPKPVEVGELAAAIATLLGRAARSQVAKS